MKLYKSIRFNTFYLVKAGKVFFYSANRKKFMPTTRDISNMLSISILVGVNYKPTLPNEAFKYVK